MYTNVLLFIVRVTNRPTITNVTLCHKSLHSLALYLIKAISTQTGIEF